MILQFFGLVNTLTDEPRGLRRSCLTVTALALAGTLLTSCRSTPLEGDSKGAPSNGAISKKSGECSLGGARWIMLALRRSPFDDTLENPQAGPSMILISEDGQVLAGGQWYSGLNSGRLQSDLEVQRIFSDFDLLTSDRSLDLFFSRNALNGSEYALLSAIEGERLSTYIFSLDQSRVGGRDELAASFVSRLRRLTGEALDRRLYGTQDPAD